MASSEVQQALPTNGHVHLTKDADSSHLRDAEHEQSTGSNPVEPTDHPEQVDGLEEAGTAAQHEQLRSAQPKESAASPVLDNPPAGQSAVSLKLKPTTSPTKRPTPTVQATTAKSVSGPPTPQVKKILNSGKFGTGLAKVVPPKATDTPTLSGKPSTTPQASSTLKPASSSNLPTKRSPVSTSTPSSKATMPPKPSTATPSAPAPTRRTSPPARSSTLSASTSGKLSSAPTSSTAAKHSAPQRTSLVSPDSTASAKSAAAPRPRASFAEGVASKKAAAPRASLAASAKQSAPSTARPTKTPGAGSISSVKEVKEGGTDLAEIQSKLDEATVSLDLKTSTISELENQVDELKASLDNITADLEAARQSLEDAELAKATADKELAETSAALETSRGDRDRLEQVSNELEAARTTAVEHNAVIETLREQIKALQAELDESRKTLEALRAEHANNSDIIAAAEVDHQALVKARADLGAIQTEITALKEAQANALDTATAKINALESQVSRAETLTAEVSSLRAEKEETSNKISELEVEILELRDAKDLAEEEREKSLTQISALQEEVATATAATGDAVQDAAAKESAAAERLDEIKKQHEAALAQVLEESKKLTEQLHNSQAEIDRLRNSLGAANTVVASTAEGHARQLAEAEQAHQTQQDELTAEIERISAELASQESAYNARVQTVKDEHDQLLQQAFERAKNEADNAHSQDLQTLREKSDAATDQVRSSHQATVESLKTEHEVELASQAQSFQKQLSGQALELKATSEDLTKAKATLSTSLQEIETLKAQVDEARQAALAAANNATAGQDAEIVRLTKELSNARDDLDALNEVLRATQESLREMGNNHQMELEEAAKGRAEEVLKLRATHDAEIQSLVGDKAGLMTKLSDLEGELLILHASTETITSPKRNGSAPAPAETVTKEDLERMHEAHNLKMNDLQARHEKDIRALKEQVDLALARADEAEHDLERKKMEISYLEQEQEESQDQITRYVKLFGFKSFLGSIFAMAVIIGSGIF
ncbi:hypothetical protein BJV74DRAFT_931690 [Russula compacta]|nr:hypothetical protein BJV74DRAFT_931690 [Russula compacta]